MMWVVSLSSSFCHQLPSLAVNFIVLSRTLGRREKLRKQIQLLTLLQDQSESGRCTPSAPTIP